MFNEERNMGMGKGKGTSVKFAVVGCGNIGSRHLAVIDADARAQLVDLCDIKKELCEKYSGLYNVRSYVDFSEMLEKTSADVINICTPHGLHAPMAIEAANAGRHILVEKPMALTVEDTLQIQEAAKKNGVRLMVVWQNRHNVPIKLVKKALEEKALGQVYMVHCSVLWNRPQSYYDRSDWLGRKDLEGGPLYTQCSHFIDLLIYMFGDIQRVNSIGETKSHSIEVEDCGVAMMKFKSGVMGTLSYTNCVYNKNYEGSMTIVGEKGTIRIGIVPEHHRFLDIGRIRSSRHRLHRQTQQLHQVQGYLFQPRQGDRRCCFRSPGRDEEGRRLGGRAQGRRGDPDDLSVAGAERGKDHRQPDERMGSAGFPGAIRGRDRGVRETG
jgi:predicted dehydrogenase